VPVHWLPWDLSAVFAILCAVGLAYVQLQDSRKRQVVAEQQRLEAERQEQEAKRVNDANQAAILRLMNELQTVAEGDLTQEATVTEDITGAIADSVNYTVEELRQLVGSVQNTATRVAQTTAQVEAHRPSCWRHRPSSCAKFAKPASPCSTWQAESTRCLDKPRSQPRWRANRCGCRVRPAGGAERHRRHELHPRPDPGNLQAHQAAGRIVAGDW
jgi:hypothetical protein